MDYCSELWSDAGIPATGSAPSARWWVALEQNGAWGAKAFTESQLDPALGARLEGLAAGAGGRLLLVRDPLAHEDHHQLTRRVLLAGGPAAAPWLGAAEITDAAELVALLEAFGDCSTLDEVPAPFVACDPVLFVCTNGRRDVCCAKFGGPLARGLAARHRGRVWECTHLGGHRFAVTTLALPSRQVLARVDVELAGRALDSSPLPLGAVHDRGLSHLGAPVMAADVWLRHELGEADSSALSYELTEAVPHGLPEGENAADGSSAAPGVLATHRDGRRWELTCTERVDEGQILPGSCAKKFAPATWWEVTGAQLGGSAAG